MIGHATSLQRSHAVWRDSMLVITTTHPTPELGAGSTTEVRQTLTLESPTSLILETTRSGVPGAPASVIRTIFRKS
jgi:hypothetical protein